jgi:methylmalonyl-CoA mutase N-terminal domain/subunit
MIEQAGQPPYTRGIHATMYQGRPFTIRQLCGGVSVSETNKRMRKLLAEGATGVSVLFDQPTIQMYDSTEPESAGQVGVVGAPVDSLRDMAGIFAGVPIDKISVSLVTHYPSNTAILFGMYLAMAEQRGIAWENLQGSVQNDFIMETVVQGGPLLLSPTDSFRMQCDNIHQIRLLAPRFNAATFNGYNLREFGCSLLTETVVAFANALAVLRDATDPVWVGERLAFFWCIGSKFIPEVSRLRAARRAWFKLASAIVGNTKGALMRCHAQTSGLSLQRQNPLTNIVRAAYQALAAVFGGVQSLHVDSYDECLHIPSEEAALVALATQKIIQDETGVTDLIDPLGGSHDIQLWTSDLECGILDGVAEIERLGGIVKAVESGWLDSKLEYPNPRRQPTGHYRPLFLGECIRMAREGATIGEMRRRLEDSPMSAPA